MKNQLIRMKHGMGDAIQSQIVIRHLKHNYPYDFIGVETLPGYEPIFKPVADAVHTMRHPLDYRDFYDEIKVLDFLRPEHWYFPGFAPNSKATRCLKNEFCLEPVKELFYYEVAIGEHAQEKVARFVDEELHGEEFALIHYQGTSKPENKNLYDGEVDLLIDLAFALGLRPVILDWRRRSVFRNEAEIVCPDVAHWLWQESGHQPEGAAADTITELINQATIFWGIDSGPEHLAGATETPTYIFWHNHHPAYCYDIADNVTHLVPDVSEMWFTSIEMDAIQKVYKLQCYGQSIKQHLQEVLDNLPAGEKSEAAI